RGGLGPLLRRGRGRGRGEGALRRVHDPPARDRPEGREARRAGAVLVSAGLPLRVRLPVAPMELIQSFFRTVYNVPELVRLGGPGGLSLVVFAETGLLVGFFLPGDSLLVTAGLFAARGDLNIVTLNLCLIAAAILGDATGYAFGRRVGLAL